MSGSNEPNKEGGAWEIFAERDWSGDKFTQLDFSEIMQASGQAILDLVDSGLSGPELKKAVGDIVKGSIKEAQQLSTPRPGPFRVAGGLLDNMNRPHTREGRTPTLFDHLPEDIGSAIIAYTDKPLEHLTQTGIAQGLHGLSATERKILIALARLHHEYSPNVDKPEDKSSFYIGHGVHDGWPSLYLTPYELAKECKGVSTLGGGKDVSDIQEELLALDGKKFLLSWSDRREGINGTRRTEKTRHRYTYEEVIKLYGQVERETDQETGDLISERREVRICLNPLFAKEIAEYFYEYPGDILPRLEATKEGKRMPQSSLVLMMYLKTRQGHGSKRKGEDIRDVIDKRTLCEKLYPKYLEQNRKALAVSYTEKALNHMVRAGLLASWTLDAGKLGQAQYVLTIPGSWPPL